MDSSEHHSKKVSIQRRDEKAKDQHDRIKAEEVEIHVAEDQTHDHQSSPHSGKFHFRTTGCLGTLLGLVALSLFFVVVLPIGIVGLLTVAGYFGWKYRHLFKTPR